MKKLIVILLTLLSLNANAQSTMTCEERATKFLIEKIKPFKSNDLIPYYSEKENKWGFFHRQTKKILTKPVLNDAYFFHPYIDFYYSLEIKGEDGCKGKIYGSNDNYKTEIIVPNDYNVYDISETRYQKKSYKDFIKESISGFEVNEKGKLTYFNPKFYNAKKDEPNIHDVINFKGKYYAIAEVIQTGYSFYTIIDQQGNSMPSFEKLEFYPTKKQTYTNETDLWFFIKIGEDDYIFKSLLKGEQMKETFNRSSNWENHSESIGYSIFTINKDQRGILDLTTMKWKIAPSSKNDFSYLAFTSLTPLLYNYKKEENISIPTIDTPLEMITENRKNSYIYIQNSKDNFYDLDLKLYKAK